MADLSTNPPVTGKSLDEIAAMMTEGRNAIEAKKQERADATAPVTQLGEEDDGELGTTEPVVEEESDGEPVGQGDEESGEGGEGDGQSDEGDEEASAAEFEELDISDDDLIELPGVDDPVSFKDLKEMYTADKVIAATLLETKAYNQEASQTRAKSQEDARMVHDAMTSLVQQVDVLISQPLVELPNEALKTSNPSEYIAQTELYQLDQKRISDGRETVTNALGDFGNKQKEFKEGRRAHELGLLANVIPDLKVEGKREAVSQQIVEAAKYYGFSKEEVSEAIDHRIYQMAYDAAQYHKIMAKGKLQ